MRLSGRTGIVVATAAGCGLISMSAAVLGLAHSPFLGTGRLALFALLVVMISATWIWPLVMYRNDESEAFNLDEGFFIIMALLLPTSAGILAFVVAAAVAEGSRRHSPEKALFNWGQVVTAAGLGLAVTRLLAPQTTRLAVGQVAAAVVGAGVFSLFNSCAMAAIIASLGASWRGALDGLGIRLRLFGSCVAVAIVSSLAISAYRWSLPLAVLPLLILRQVLAGHFQARHDRTRVVGLFDAALEANRFLGDADPLTVILESARKLLRCPVAAVSATPPGADQLGANMLVNGEPSWLVVSGRSRNEPFDGADKTLLEALAAVGAGALSNIRLYREGRFQRERLAAITSSLGEGVCALDSSGQVTFMNPAAAAMLGWEPALGPSPAEAEDAQGDLQARPVVPESFSALALQVVASGETLRRDDAEVRRQDGAWLPVSLTGSPILEEGQVAGAVIVFRDTSERRAAETATRVARDQAIEASRLKSQFLANMSHEIRTPMNGVLGLSRMLLETEVNETQRKYLLALRDCGENLMVIINDVLDFSKIEAGKLDLEDVVFDLGACLASVVNAMAVPAQDKGLALRLITGPDLPRRIGGDSVRLRQVLTNLVGNAIKFTHEGGITVTAGATDAGRLRIAVTDTGIGIDPAARVTVLEAFGQADASTTRRYGGTGLGLAICRQLVGLMGGVLDFASQPGQGSTFWFEVPFRVADTLAEEEPALSPEGQEPRQEPLARQPLPAPRADGQTVGQVRLRVLLADDARINQLVAASELERLGYEVDLAATGEEALSAVQQTHYDAVLMDCLMPIMDGYEATRRIRRLEGEAGATQIIAMTASAMVGDREECLLAGMDDYLSKPLNRDLLAAALARATHAAERSRKGGLVSAR